MNSQDRVVVVGHGMVGARFAEDLAVARDDLDVVVIGKEGVPAYNRVLLSGVVAGTSSTAGLTMAGPAQARLIIRSGVGVTGIDHTASEVVTSAGDRVGYDTLVLATGSRARIPAIHGVADPNGLVRGVHVLKDLADAEGIVASASRARRAVVLGAGVLGLEVAAGLAARGLEVDLVHLADRVMDRHLGWEAALATTAGLRRLGVTTHVGAAITRVQTARGRLTSVRLANGSELDAELLVMCVGTIPDTLLARQAGLVCDAGIVVDEQMRTSDPRIRAIGDCAQPPEGSRGLVAQGWAQAARLVAELSGAQPAASGRAADVLRVKIPGMPLVAMGVCGDFDRQDPRYRVLSLTDASAGRHVELVVSGSRLAGVTAVGDTEVAASLAALYTRRLPVPLDPAQLMVRALAGPNGTRGGDPADLEDTDQVCTCNAVSAGRVRQAVAAGASSVAQVAAATRATTGCGGCTAVVQGLVSCHASTPDPTPDPVPPVTEGVPV